VTTREERLGVNEAVFREVNERIQELADAFKLQDEQLDLLCECSQAECVDRISMTRAEYEEVRSEANQFALRPGHEEPDVERVIVRRTGYYIVQKFGAPEHIAEQTDPRA
jgi:hypothetical protein